MNLNELFTELEIIYGSYGRSNLQGEKYLDRAKDVVKYIKDQDEKLKYLERIISNVKDVVITDPEDPTCKAIIEVLDD